MSAGKKQSLNRFLKGEVDFRDIQDSKIKSGFAIEVEQLKQAPLFIYPCSTLRRIW